MSGLQEIRSRPKKTWHTFGSLQTLLRVAREADVLAGAGVILGKTYPRPMVDHATARGEALEAFAILKAMLKEEA